MRFDGIFKVFFNSKRLNIEELKIPKVAKSQSILHEVFVEVVFLHIPISHEIPKPPCCLKGNLGNHWLTGHFISAIKTVDCLASSTLTDFCLRFSSCKQEGAPGCLSKEMAGFPSLKHIVLMGFFVLFCGRVFARQKYTNIMNKLRMLDAFLVILLRISENSKINTSGSRNAWFMASLNLLLSNLELRVVSGDFTCQFYVCIENHTVCYFAVVSFNRHRKFILRMFQQAAC